MNKKLKDVLPQEFFEEFMDSKASKFLDVEVVQECSNFKWPGPHKNVYHWWILENGKKVAWNENPARGWSFPIV
jgi:hypothetical protein